jgi:hypothetical protein
MVKKILRGTAERNTPGNVKALTDLAGERAHR